MDYKRYGAHVMAVLQQAMLAPNTTASPVVLPFEPLVHLFGVRTTVASAGYTLLTKIPGSLITRTGSKIRIFLESGGTACTLNNVTIGPAVTAGSAWNCSSVTTVTMGGSTTWAISGGAGTLFVSDEITFAVNAGVAYIIGINQDSTANALSRRASLNIGTGALSGIVSYVKAAVQEADDATRGASYVAQSNIAYHLWRLDIQ